MADWSMLPCDILGEITLKLDQFEDFIYFSVVCHSWNHASSLVKPKWNPNAVTPWLLLAENTNENPDCLRKVYNLSNNKCYQLKLPETFGARCWGSRYGWIVIQTYDCQVHLFNPLTKVRITSLPSVLTLFHQLNDSLEPDDPDLKPEDPLEVHQWIFDHFVVRFVVLKMPRNLPLDDDGDGDLLIAAIYGPHDYLAFARPGDQTWTYIDYVVKDVVCWGDLIYTIRVDGNLQYCDFKRFGDLKDVKVMDYAPGFRAIINGFDKVFLLDLCGDLVMVVREKKRSSHYDYLTFHFDVYRLDYKTKKWVEIKDIGNFSIFVGHNSSMSIPITVANNCIKNCIYFTDDENDNWREVPGGHDMGVYNISSGDIIQFYEGDDTRSPFCPPIFFLPKC